LTVNQNAELTSRFVLDASVIINLLGCGHASDILAAIRSPFLVEERTLMEIQRHPISGRSHIDELAALKAAGLLQLHRMSDEAYALYLDLIDDSSPACLGDGESAAIATAATLGYRVALDDRKARKILAKRFPQITPVTTVGLFFAASMQNSYIETTMPKIIESAVRHSRMAILKEERHLIERFIVSEPSILSMSRQ
jgi:predicted nucleic acid-binding protein